jgi:protein-tyrosine-phosphatase
MTSVALICTANRCRSVIGHAILASEIEKRGLPVELYSAGVLDFRGAPAIDDTTRTCALHNTPAPTEVATWVGDLPLDSITRFLVMEQFHADELIENHGIASERVSLLGEFDPQQRSLEIDDPFSQSSVVYDTRGFATASLITSTQPTSCEVSDSQRFV